jgi:hypothetical protein
VALTDSQKASVRLYAGWSARFRQYDTRIEQSMSALETFPEHEAQVVSLLESLADIDSKLTASHARLKASEVGSIKLNPSELPMLRSEGRRLVARLCSILGVERGVDVYGSGAVSASVGFDQAHAGAGGNYVGK